MSGSVPSPRRFANHILYQTTDLAVARERWSSAAQPVQLTCLRGPFAASVSGLEIPGFAIFWAEAQGLYRVRTVQQGNSFSLLLLQEGRGEWRWPCNADPVRADAGSVLLTAPGVDVEYVVENPAGLTIKVGMTSIDRVRLMALPYARRAALSGPVLAPDQEDLARLMLFLGDEIDRRQNAASRVHPQVSVLMEALTQRSTYVLRERLGSVANASPGDIETVRQCDGAISSSADIPRSVSDLTKRVPWSARQIYRAFDRVCDCTPTDYLRRVALLAARSKLEIPVGDKPALRDVALEVGYRSVEAFERDYVAEYGVRP